MYKKITTIAAAFKYLGIPKDFVYDASQWPESMRAHKIIEFNLQMVILAINEKWEADWTNTDEFKYWIWWNIISKIKGVSGRGLSLGDVDCVDSDAGVGPRHVFKDKERAKHAAQYFLPLYETFILGAPQAKAKSKKK